MSSCSTSNSSSSSKGCVYLSSRKALFTVTAVASAAIALKLTYVGLQKIRGWYAGRKQAEPLAAVADVAVAGVTVAGVEEAGVAVVEQAEATTPTVEM